jgi:hypothetical protein
MSASLPNMPADPRDAVNASLSPRTRTRNVWIRVAQWLFAAIAIGFVLVQLKLQWSEIGERVTMLHPRWGYLALASLLVLCVYALLIEAWRRMLAEWDTTLHVGTAARIWFAAGLAKYIPGYVWALTAMGVMARRQGASPVAAAGSSIVINVLNLGSAAAVVLVCGADLVGNLVLVSVLMLGVLGGAAIVPAFLPRFARWLAKVTKRDFPIPTIRARVIWLLLLWTALAWIGYGVAFQLFSAGILAHPGHDGTLGSPLLYIAVYTAAYVGGLAAPTPAGVGTREGVLMVGLPQFHLMSPADAIIVAFTSRIWLTILEVVPGVIALIITQTKTRTRHA